MPKKMLVLSKDFAIEDIGLISEDALLVSRSPAVNRLHISLMWYRQ